jgi:diphosphomevalonate decarboxylase
MTKATAQAHSNIALVKYWGKGDPKLRLPVNSSAAITLSDLTTTTTVEFQDALKRDNVTLLGDGFEGGEYERVTAHLDIVRKMAGITTKAKVVSQNSFPKAAGMASSASGFAALSVAAAQAAGLELDTKALSILARQGSGSASRSIPGGVSVWHRGVSSDTSFAENISYPKEWNLRVLLVMAEDTSSKKVGSTEGMALASTSPYFTTAVQEAEGNIEKLQTAMNAGDWTAFGKVVEDECYRLHTICMTTTPNILYWRGVTVEVFQKLYSLRQKGLEAFFTVDAGPHVHVICKGSDVAQIKKELSRLPGIKTIVESGVGDGAHLLSDHLF